MADIPMWRRIALCAAAALALGLAAQWASAAPVCVDPERAAGAAGAKQGAIGGTGVTAGAIGGTGALAGAVGETGAAAGAVGGTGATAEGIGGTGAIANGGIGGTGDLADGIGGTGIVGTITGFASVCVNGLEVHYDAKTPVSDNGTESSPAQLAVGQVVAIEAAPSPRGLSARTIAVLHTLAGPVTQAQAGGSMLSVMGQPVSIGPATRIAAGGGPVAVDSLRPGIVVKVSGFRKASGEVVASRIDEAPDLSTHSAIGTVRAPSSTGFKLDGTPVRGTRGAASSGGEALVRGRWRDGRLSAADVRAEPTAAALGRAERIVLEGIVRSRSGDSLSVGEFSVRMSPATRIEGRAPGLDERVRITGRVDRDRRVRAERIGVAPGVDNGAGAARASPEAARERDDKRKGDRDSRRDGDARAAKRGDSSERRGGGEARAGGGAEKRAVSRERTGRNEHTEHRDIPAGRGKPHRNERVERPDRGERRDRAERPDKVERPDKAERPDKSERPDRVERPAKVERPDKPEVEHGGHD